MKIPFLKHSLSGYAVLVAIAFIATIRLSHVDSKETSWDVLGYYLPLPATFVHHDPMLNDRSWVEKVNKEKDLSGTLYQISSTPDGKPMYFFLFGMALFYLPSFLAGHGWASITGAPTDGFSEPYQYALVIGGIIYTLIGILLLRKILRYYFTEKIAAITILIVVFATNYSHHLSYKNLETVNILFMLMCWLIWSVIRWREQYKFTQMLQAGTAITLMALVKPSEVMTLFIPLFWGVYSRQTLIDQIQTFWKYRLQLIGVVACCILLASPQILYWHAKTGEWLYDTYKNPGIGLDIFHPHILEVLFSYRKGWLVYTPVMLLGLFGLILLFKSHKQIAFSLTLYFLISFYIICSWTEWWYGAAFSCRPVITAYPILAIGIGALLTRITSRTLTFGLGAFVVLCTALNQFQWWQLMEGIYDPYRTTKTYYWAIFLKTKAPYNAESLKSVFRSFDENQEWNDKFMYRKVREVELVKSTPEWSDQEFDKLVYKKPFGSLTSSDHLWMDITVTYETSDSTFSYGPFMTACMTYKGEAYGYRGKLLTEQTDTINGQLVAHYRYLTTEARTPQDEFVTCIWNPGHHHLRILSYKIGMYARR